MTGGLEAVFDAMPYAELLGMELREAGDGHASGFLELTDEHSSVRGTTVAHGGVVQSLADHVGGAAVISLYHRPTPTVDIRYDHLAPAQHDLVAEAKVIEDGDDIAVAEIEVRDVEDTHVAAARGVYKTGEGDSGGAWGDAGDVGE